MDFTFSAEQEALGETARDYLADRHAPDRPAADPEAVWKELAGLGWLDPLGTVELGVLAEETGYALLPAPWLSTVALAGPALRAGGVAETGPATLAWAEPSGGPANLASTAGVQARADGATVTGYKVRVPDAGAVRWLVVVAREGLCLVDRETVEVVPDPATADPGRREDGVRLDRAPARPLVPAPSAGLVLAATRHRALALTACEAVGVARRALAVAVEHARVRVQFGRPIGANQAVSHPLAEAYAGIDLARSLAYRAAWCVGESPDPAEAVLSASVAARRAAVEACEAAIQTLGAIGVTWEHPIHRWYARARQIAGFDGFPAALRAELAGLLLD